MTLNHEYHSLDNTPALYVAPWTNAANAVQLTGVPLTNANALHIAIVDGNGDQITSFGGGTQYADGAARGTATGTLAMVDDGTNIQSIAGDSLGRLKIATIETSITPGTAATNLGKAEDAPHSSGDVGVMALGVRNDTGAVLAGSDGDYLPLTTDSTGALRTDLNGTVSTNNSSTATLTANSVFTGTGEDVLNYNEMRITVIASHASATDGLSIQQSSDNSNWDITDTYTVAATTGKTYSVPRQARYFRVVYTNGGTNQTSFRLQTILNRLGSQASSQRPGDAYTNETDLQQMWAFNSLWNGATWDRMKGDTTNGLWVNVKSGIVTGSLTHNNAVPGANNIGALTALANAVSPTFTETDLTLLSVNLTGNLRTTLQQISGTTILTGNGTTGAGSQRVTIASDNTPFPVKIDQTTPGTTNAVAIAQLGSTTISTGVGATGAGVQRMVIANDAGRTLVSKGGSAGSNGDNTLVAAGTNKLKVYAFSISTISATAVTCIFQSGASGTELWRVVLQTPASVAGGANLVVQPPAWLFSTAAATLLNLNLSAAVTVHWSVSYFDEA